MGPPALAIQFEDDLFKVIKDLNPPTWASLKKSSSPLEIRSLCQGTSKSNMRKIAAIPPFIANTLYSSPQMKAEDVFIHCQAAILSFDDHFKGENSFPKAEEECRDLIKAWSEKLHLESVIPPAPAPVIDFVVAVPSNATLSNSASSLSLLKESLEKQLFSSPKEKEEKKNKFLSIPPFAKKMILNASTEDCINPAMSITPEVKLIMEQPSLSSQQNMLNHLLQTMGCMIDIPTALVAFLILGDWIIRNSNKPGKLTIMLLGR
eukprot:9718885-Ditylum_brightwellii.AAC.1